MNKKTKIIKMDKEDILRIQHGICPDCGSKFTTKTAYRICFYCCKIYKYFNDKWNLIEYRIINGGLIVQNQKAKANEKGGKLTTVKKSKTSCKKSA